MQALSLLKPAAAAVGERSRALHTIWRRAAQGRPVPRREDITLRDVGKLSAWLVLIEVLDDGADFRVRLIGDGLVRFFDTDFAGTRLSVLKDRPFFALTLKTLERCVRQREPIAFGPTNSRLEGKQHWECESVFLPLSEDGTAVNGIIGTMDLWQAGATGPSA